MKLSCIRERIYQLPGMMGSFSNGIFLSYFVPPGLHGGMYGSGCFHSANFNCALEMTSFNSLGSEILLFDSNCDLILIVSFRYASNLSEESKAVLNACLNKEATLLLLASVNGRIALLIL